MLRFGRTSTIAMPLLLSLIITTILSAGEPKIDLKTRDKNKPVFVLLYRDTDDYKGTIRAMENVAKKYDVKIESWNFGIVDEDRFKLDVLTPISVFQQIKIHQPNNTKRLYPHMVIYFKGKPLTYYPQTRKGEPTVTIDSFLARLQAGEIIGIESVGELRRYLKEIKPKMP